MAGGRIAIDAAACAMVLAGSAFANVCVQLQNLKFCCIETAESVWSASGWCFVATYTSVNDLRILYTDMLQLASGGRLRAAVIEKVDSSPIVHLIGLLYVLLDLPISFPQRSAVG